MRIPDNMFRPELYSGVRRPIGEATTLPFWCYSSPEWFDREMTNIFRPSWHFVGLATDLNRRGHFFTSQVLGEPIIIVRTDTGIKAYRNSCRHRGALLTDKDSGVCGGFRCKYHSWVYGLDGSLLRAPGAEELTEFDATLHSLTTLRMENLHGLLFVSLANVGSSATQYFGDFVDRIARPYRVDEMVCVHRRNYVLRSNWKLYVEFDMETLHTDHIHKSSIGTQPVQTPRTEGEWVTVFNRGDHTPALMPGERHLGFPSTPGIDGPALEGTHFSVLSPGFFLVTAPDCMWWIKKVPESAVTTRVDVGYCFAKASVERADYDEVSARYVRRWNQVIEEDDWITEYQQQGIIGSEVGTYVPRESVVHRVDNWILDRVLGVSDDLKIERDRFAAIVG